jgi:hypothetical protein
MRILLSPDAPTDRGADYADAFAGIDAIEGSGLDNPMGSPAQQTPQDVAPAPAVSAPVVSAPAPADLAKPKNEDFFNLDKFASKKDEPAPAAKPEATKPEPTSIKQFREQYDLTKKERDDFAAGTSSRSTKLIHGGVRYLEQVKVVLKQS